MRNISFVLLMLILPFVTETTAQTSALEHVLNSIEANNKELKAERYLNESQKLEAKTDNNLPDPTVSYSHLWGQKNSSNTIQELEISQSFDFPTLYASRSRLNKLKMSSIDMQTEIARRNILLQAKELCLDIITLRKQKAIFAKRLHNANELAEIYAVRLENGDASILETNNINLEVLNVKTEAAQIDTDLANKINMLTALNGNIPIDFSDMEFPVVMLPSDFQQLKEEVLASDFELQAVQRETSVANQQISVNRSQWLPKLEVGYRRDNDSGDPFNGVMVGVSIPLFENRNKVKMAKAQSLNLSYKKDNTALQIESELIQLYNEAQAAKSTMEEYEKVFNTQNALQLLREALTGREISMVDYFVEAAVVYQSQLNYLQVQNQYQKAMAKIYKNRL